MSFVLNGRPGVAPATAGGSSPPSDELDWRPSNARAWSTPARTPLASSSPGRPSCSPSTRSSPRFIAGIEAELSARQASLVLRVVPDIDAELAAYRQLAADNRVDGVLLADLRVDDPRPDALAEIGLPAVTLGRPEGRRRCPAVVLEDVAGVIAGVEHLVDLGHGRVAFVGGPDEFLHARSRRGVAVHAPAAHLRDDLTSTATSVAPVATATAGCSIRRSPARRPQSSTPTT